jgi:hypothetical protein
MPRLLNRKALNKSNVEIKTTLFFLIPPKMMLCEDMHRAKTKAKVNLHINPISQRSPAITRLPYK